MKLDKTNVCVLIESEAHLQQARELLEKYSQEIDEDMFYLSHNGLNYLQLADNDYGWWLAINHKYNGDSLKEITLSELDEILKEESDGN